MSDEQNEIDNWDETICGNVANLSAALSNLSDVDTGLMSQQEQKEFKRMRGRIFKALKLYCDCLPEILQNEDPKEV